MRTRSIWKIPISIFAGLLFVTLALGISPVALATEDGASTSPNDEISTPPVSSVNDEALSLSYSFANGDTWTKDVAASAGDIEVASGTAALDGVSAKLGDATGISYRVRRSGQADFGEWVCDGTPAPGTGTIEAIQIKLTDELSSKYVVYYRVHVSGTGWLAWAKSGEQAGSDAAAGTLDCIQIALVATGDEAPSSPADTSAYLVAQASDDTTTDTPSNSDDTGNSDNTDSSDDTDTTGTDADVDTANVSDPISAKVSYRTHVQNLGWQGWNSDGAVAGTTGRSLRVEALSAKLDLEGTTGGIRYTTHVQYRGWQTWSTDGATSGTTGKSLRVEAVRFELTGDVAEVYDIYYRVHVQNTGWTTWVKNGAIAGTTGRSLRLEALQVVLVAKGAAAPEGTTADAATSGTTTASIWYRGHVQNIGWQGWSADGALSGTRDMGLRLEGIQAKLEGVEGSVSYGACVRSSWIDAADGEMAGTTGRSLPISAVRYSLSGEASELFDIYYHVYIPSYGWLGWAKNGEAAGTGDNKQVEAVEIVLVAKGGGAPGSTDYPYITAPTLSYRSHVQNYGWQGWSAGGAASGTTGRSLRVEALQMRLAGEMPGSISYQVHIQNTGWASWASNGATAGTTGKSLRIEAMKVQLSGDAATYYDVWYRVHVENVGWMGWAKNGAIAGTTSASLRVEAYQVMILPKGASAPGSTSRPYIDGKTVSKIGYQNPAGYYQVSSKTVVLAAKAYSTPFGYVTPSRISIAATRSQCVEAFIARAYEYIGTPYVWNYARQPGVGVDCIGLVMQCCYATGMNLGEFNPYEHYYTGANGWHSHDANNMWNYGKVRHVSLAARQRGDVISWPGHVAIYIGGDRMIEAYPGRGVYIANLWAHGTPRGCMRFFQ